MRLAHEVLATEYNVLMAALSAAWSASLTRTSLFLGVLTAAGVGFAFASQGGMETSTFLTLSLLVLILVLFLGIATFIRLVEVQRESMVYITGMNRIRHFFTKRLRPVARTSSSLSTTNRLPTAALEPGCAGNARGFDSCT